MDNVENNQFRYEYPYQCECSYEHSHFLFLLSPKKTTNFKRNLSFFYDKALQKYFIEIHYRLSFEHTISCFVEKINIDFDKIRQPS